MNLLAAALLLPALFWDKGPETLDQLLRAQIDHISVPSSIAQSWKAASKISVQIEDPGQYTKAVSPSVTLRRGVGSATRAPWVNANGWRFVRSPDAHFFYDETGIAAALAAAESFMYGVRATIHADNQGLDPFGKMLAFLQQTPEEDLPPKINVGFLDDGSPESGEFMNLLVRRNLLFKVVQHPDQKLDLNVALGSPEYPRSEAANPQVLAEKVRANLTDEKRFLRIYGSEVVVGRLLGDAHRARLFLINYGAARSSVQGVRIRILGAYRTVQARQYNESESKLSDISNDSTATEFTVPELKMFAIIDLNQ